MTRFTVFCFAAAYCWTTSSLASAADLQAGAAVADITPPTGYRMSGYFYERLNTGTHDPLKAKAIVLKQGDTQIAWVFCDLVGLSLDVSRRARQEAAQQTGIPEANILISATHSHTGPMYFDVLRDHFHRLAVKEHGKDPREEVDYPARLAAAIAESIHQAHQTLRPAALNVGIAHEDTLSFNRRFHMKDGTVRFNPGKRNPDIVRAAGPIDPDVAILLLRDATDQIAFAGITVFAMHLDTVGGTEYSGDYPFYLEASLREVLGQNFVSAFGAGTCGDINHIDVSDERRQGGQEEARRIGFTLASTVKNHLVKMQAPVSPSLAARRAIVDAPLQTYTAEQLAEAEEAIFKVGKNQLPFLKEVEVCKILALRDRGGPSIPLEVQVFRLAGDTALVGLPGEVFVELGMAIKKQSPFANTLVVELCNDTPDYVPTQKAFREGSYETVNSLVKTGGGEMMVEAALRMLHELKP